MQYCSDNGSVVVECRFAERSTADGCHVKFNESPKRTVKSINMSKSSIEESTVYQYISLPVSGNYTVTAHDIVDGTIITNPSVVYPQVLEYILLLPSPTETFISASKRSSYTVTISEVYYYIGNTSNEWTSSLINGNTDTADNTISTTNIMSTVKPTNDVFNGNL